MSGVSHSALLASYGGVPAGTIYIESQQTDTTDASTYNFTIDGHEPQADRRIFLAIHYIEGSSHRTIPSVTINGVSASVRQIGHNGGATGLGAAIAHAVVPTTDGSMTATVNFSGSATTCVVCPVVTYGFASSATDFATDESSSGSALSLSVGVDIPEGGFVLAVYTGSTNADGNAVTWTGATEQYDFDTGAGNNAGRASMAFSSDMSLETNRTIQAAISVALDAGNDMVVESWGLAA